MTPTSYTSLISTAVFAGMLSAMLYFGVPLPAQYCSPLRQAASAVIGYEASSTTPN